MTSFVELSASVLHKNLQVSSVSQGKRSVKVYKASLRHFFHPIMIFDSTLRSLIYFHWIFSRICWMLRNSMSVKICFFIDISPFLRYLYFN